MLLFKIRDYSGLLPPPWRISSYIYLDDTHTQKCNGWPGAGEETRDLNLIGKVCVCVCVWLVLQWCRANRQKPVTPGASTQVFSLWLIRGILRARQLNWGRPRSVVNYVAPVGGGTARTFFVLIGPCCSDLVFDETHRCGGILLLRWAPPQRGWVDECIRGRPSCGYSH